MTEKLQSIKKKLKKELDKERYQHTLGVMYTASCLAMTYGTDTEQAMFAGLLHDCAKCIPNGEKVKLCEKYHVEMSDVEKENPFLLHAKLGASLARSKYGVEDADILHAISVHTTGEADMNLLDKIIFVSDYIEPHRDKAPNLTEIRYMAFHDIDQAVLKILHDTLNYLNQKRGAIDKKTHETYEYYQKLLES
ncbi:MAG: bis(5'-nucleosyl)-tetraphosphatase (symmetrical) YqeK [Lachnospiraceae bacterium]|nr:bis(5'-nucleosyl)-tetraphosphatase (symmetrical) YqeK [Lachnospiraceae bacterium]MDE6982024.1 bis(5'-nucleosyl)-tetraphosphatase (symmetrical) YqeK [Lachnospiraceae bacterium]